MPLPFAIIPVALAILLFGIYRKLIADLMDEVFDAGDYLIIRNKGAEERIDLANIINVNHSVAMNPARITLTLRTPCRFGEKVSFCPEVKWTDIKALGFNIALADDFVRRIEALRARQR